MMEVFVREDGDQTKSHAYRILGRRHLHVTRSSGSHAAITIWLKTLVILSYNSYIYEFCAIYYKSGRINVMPRGKLRNMEDFILLFMLRLILIRVLNLLLSNNNLSKRGRRNEAYSHRFRLTLNTWISIHS